MKTASILLALVVVVGFSREAEAYDVRPYRNYTITVAEHIFGFTELPAECQSPYDMNTPLKDIRTLHLGPLGSHQVPFTATQSLVGFSFILALLLILPVVLTVRWKKKRRLAE